MTDSELIRIEDRESFEARLNRCDGPLEAAYETILYGIGSVAPLQLTVGRVVRKSRLRKGFDELTVFDGISYSFDPISLDCLPTQAEDVCWAGIRVASLLGSKAQLQFDRATPNAVRAGQTVGSRLTRPPIDP